MKRLSEAEEVSELTADNCESRVDLAAFVSMAADCSGSTSLAAEKGCHGFSKAPIRSLERFRVIGAGSEDEAAEDKRAAGCRDVELKDRWVTFASHASLAHPASRSQKRPLQDQRMHQGKASSQTKATARARIQVSR